LDLTRELPWAKTIVSKPQFSTTEDPDMKRKFSKFPYGVWGIFIWVTILCHGFVELWAGKRIYGDGE
jgi:hypothetical protein